MVDIREIAERVLELQKAAQDKPTLVGVTNSDWCRYDQFNRIQAPTLARAVLEQAKETERLKRIEAAAAEMERGIRNVLQPTYLPKGRIPTEHGYLIQRGDFERMIAEVDEFRAAREVKE